MGRDHAGPWQDWIGRSERQRDRVDTGLVRRWLATLDRPIPLDDAVPQGLHWCLCLPDAPCAQLGPDGHPRRDENPDSFLPPIPLPRRMWASSSLELLQPLRFGAEMERISTISAITEKHGRSGSLAFVDIMHELRADGVPALREVQTLVYREAAPAGAPPVPPALQPAGAAAFDPSPWPVLRTIVPDAPLLFRYSALTFNSHRIHYDLPYAQSAEGYRGLVVHGPLMATLLLDLARRELGDNVLRTFSFRGLSPAICGEALHLAMDGTGSTIRLAAFAADGRQIMAANASV